MQKVSNSAETKHRQGCAPGRSEVRLPAIKRKRLFALAHRRLALKSKGSSSPTSLRTESNTSDVSEKPRRCGTVLVVRSVTYLGGRNH